VVTTSISCVGHVHITYWGNYTALRWPSNIWSFCFWW